MQALSIIGFVRRFRLQESTDRCIALAASIYAAKPLDQGIDRGGVADHMVGVKIKADFAGAGGNEKTLALRRIVVRVEKSLHHAALCWVSFWRRHEFVAFQAAHRAGEHGNLGIAVLVLLRQCLADRLHVFGRFDENDNARAGL